MPKYSYRDGVVSWTDEDGTPRAVAVLVGTDPAIVESIECAVNEGDYGDYYTEDEFWDEIIEALKPT